MKTCPSCQTTEHVHRSRSEGFWEQQLLTRIGIKAFRCSTCRERFYRWSWKSKVPQPPDHKKALAGFLTQRDAGFDEVVARIARREAELERRLEAEAPADGSRKWWHRAPGVALAKGDENVRAS